MVDGWFSYAGNALKSKFLHILRLIPTISSHFLPYDLNRITFWISNLFLVKTLLPWFVILTNFEESKIFHQNIPKLLILIIITISYYTRSKILMPVTRITLNCQTNRGKKNMHNKDDQHVEPFKVKFRLFWPVLDKKKFIEKKKITCLYKL